MAAPMIRAASRASCTRSSGVPALEASPFEVTRMRASCPLRTSWIKMGAQPNSTSSGCAPTARILIMSRRLSFGNGNAVKDVALLHRVHDVLTREHLPEDGVLSVQMGGDHMSDEELASVGVRPGVSHRKRPDLMPMGIALALVCKAVAGSAPATSLRIAALDHEVGDHPVERRAVIELIPGQEHKIVHGQRRVFGEQLADDLAA